MFDMRPLLAAVRDALRDGLDDVRSHDVYLTGHENHLPDGVRYPCVGIKGGAIRRTEKAGNIIEAKAQVLVVVYAQLGRIGAETNDVQGLAAAVHQVLDDNTLGLPGVLNAFSPSEGGGDWFGNETGVLLRKDITYEYETEGPRP